eukprot:TRINITY_DN3363_c0_g1_i2.p1 TRINITY_DN3363_c0_g1~~TRINITY_DN3363_c0_g1_i2.p1  ORF type:complete len:325 (-),score=85.29 TRINITY_DN3363_c0_g1_i2:384-1358(-)
MVHLHVAARFAMCLLVLATATALTSSSEQMASLEDDALLPSMKDFAFGTGAMSFRLMSPSELGESDRVATLTAEQKNTAAKEVKTKAKEVKTKAKDAAKAAKAAGKKQKAEEKAAKAAAKHAEQFPPPKPMARKAFLQFARGVVKSQRKKKNKLFLDIPKENSGCVPDLERALSSMPEPKLGKDRFRHIGLLAGMKELRKRECDFHKLGCCTGEKCPMSLCWDGVGGETDKNKKFVGRTVPLVVNGQEMMLVVDLEFNFDKALVCLEPGRNQKCRSESMCERPKIQVKSATVNDAGVAIPTSQEYKDALQQKALDLTTILCAGV